jgi:hypothetical protein
VVPREGIAPLRGCDNFLIFGAVRASPLFKDTRAFSYPGHRVRASPLCTVFLMGRAPCENIAPLRASSWVVCGGAQWRRESVWSPQTVVERFPQLKQGIQSILARPSRPCATLCDLVRPCVTLCDPASAGHVSTRRQKLRVALCTALCATTVSPCWRLPKVCLCATIPCATLCGLVRPCAGQTVWCDLVVLGDVLSRTNVSNEVGLHAPHRTSIKFNRCP